MVEVSSLTFEIKDIAKFFPQFINSLKEEEFIDLNEDILNQAIKLLKTSIDEDFQEAVKKIGSSFRTKILVNPEIKTSILLEINIFSRRGRSREQTLYEITIFSDDLKNNIKIVELIKDILITKIKIKSDIIEGDIKEFALFYILNRLKDTHRSELIEKVTEDMIGVFIDKENREVLKNFANIPYKIIPQIVVKNLKNHKKLVDVNILKENYVAYCNKCLERYGISPTAFETREALIKNLKDEVMLCPQCGRKLTINNASIESAYSFTELGLESAKGLWFEAYIRSILLKEGVLLNNMKCCNYHDKDELDHVFIDSSNLVVCECKDRNLGQNDIYITAMKATRLGADKVLLISTEPISKDILPQTEEATKPIYVPISGNIKDISKNLKSEILKMREQYVIKKLKNMGEIISRLDFERTDWTFIRSFHELARE